MALPSIHRKVYLIFLGISLTFVLRKRLSENRTTPFLFVEGKSGHIIPVKAVPLFLGGLKGSSFHYVYSHSRMNFSVAFIV